MSEAPLVPLISVREVRGAREKLAEDIAGLVRIFEKRAQGVKVSSIQVKRTDKADRRGIKTQWTSVLVTAELKDGAD